MDYVSISKKYVLYTRVPLYRSPDGRLYCEALWAKDLALHFKYIVRLSLCCPIINVGSVDNLVDISQFNIERIFELAPDKGLGSVLINLIPNFWVSLKGARFCDIAHTDGGGWAFPLSFYLLLLRPFVSFKWVVNIESSFWMLDKFEGKSLRQIVSHVFHKRLLASSIHKADASMFTQSFYASYFGRVGYDNVLISPATWVDEGSISELSEVRNRFSSRGAEPIQIIYPSRLTEEKGTLVVLDALEFLKDRGVEVNVVIVGFGELEDRCRDAASRFSGSVSVSFHAPVDYGEAFNQVLRSFDYVLVPLVKQEQPRIIFDAFAQGVPVIGASTSGIADVTDSSNCVYFEPGSSLGLAECIAGVVDEGRDNARKRGEAGLQRARGRTHESMHCERSSFLFRNL